MSPLYVRFSIKDQKVCVAFRRNKTCRDSVPTSQVQGTDVGLGKTVEANEDIYTVVLHLLPD